MPITRPAPKFQPHPSRLGWRRDGTGWLLLADRRRFGRAVPDPDHAGMWRSTLGRGELSDMVNLTRAKNAVLVAAERELEFEDRAPTAIDPSKPQHSGGVFWRSSSLVRQNGRAGVLQRRRDGAAL
jgi:hypothetical protein